MERDEVIDWMKERMDNCNHIADSKTFGERAGWLEDARFFQAAIAMLRANTASVGGANACPRIKKAAEALYSSGYWTCDRPVDESALWEELRDACGIAPGQSPLKL